LVHMINNSDSLNVKHNQSPPLTLDNHQEAPNQPFSLANCKLFYI
jgi:hypothetical protein